MTGETEFVTRREYDQRHGELLDLIRSDLEKTNSTALKMASLEGWVKGALVGVGMLTAVASILGVVVPLLLRG